MYLAICILRQKWLPLAADAAQDVAKIVIHPVRLLDVQATILHIDILFYLWLRPDGEECRRERCGVMCG